MALLGDGSKFVRNAFALAAQRVILSNFVGLVFNAKTINSADGSKSVQDVAASNIKSSQSTSSLSLPASLFTQTGSAFFVARINLNTFASSTLFQPAEKANIQLKVSSDIISASVEGTTINNLSEDDPIALTFKREDVSTNISILYSV